MDIKAHFAKNNLKEADLAKALGVKQAMANHIINGRRQVPIKKMAAFEKFTGIPRRQFRPELFQ